MSCCAPGSEPNAGLADPASSASEILLASHRLDGDLRQTDLAVPGIHCGACIHRVEAALNALPGVCRAGFARVVERGGEHDRHTRQNAGEQQQAVLERVQAEEAGCVCEHRQ